MHNRIGPFRLWVDLARILAKGGYHVLRFDLSGMGDSEPARERLDDDAQLELDMSEALGFLSTKYAIDRFIMIGLCSGVPGAHAMALKNDRVIAAAFIDGYTYKTFSYYLQRRLIRFFYPELWVRFFRRRLSQLRRSGDLIDSAPVAPPRFYSGAAPPLARFRDEIIRMVRRGMPLLFVYTGEVQDHFNGRRQFYEMLGPELRNSPLITLRYQAAADHLFQSLAQRNGLIAQIRDWLQAVELGRRSNGVSASGSAYRDMSAVVSSSGTS
jgi:pimeloyl-ACP methyl ester carboxylesterase